MCRCRLTRLRHWTRRLRLCFLSRIPGGAPLRSVVIWSGRGDMLCEICHKREATVHLTSNVPTDDLIAHPELKGLVGEHDVCDVCVPAQSMSKEELDATVRKLFLTPPSDWGGKAGGES